MDSSLRRLTTILVLVLLFSLTEMERSEAHFGGGVSKVIGNYRVQFVTEPSLPTPGKEVSLLFSIQDLNANNIDNVNASVRIVSGDKIVHEFPYHRYPSGDFALNYAFRTEGDFRVVLYITESRGDLTVDFPLSVLTEALAFLVTYVIILFFVSILVITGLSYLRNRMKRARATQA